MVALFITSEAGAGLEEGGEAEVRVRRGGREASTTGLMSRLR